MQKLPKSCCFTLNILEPTGEIFNPLLQWRYGFWSCQSGDKEVEIFLSKDQLTQRKLLNFEFWIHGELSNVPKFDFQSQSSMSKIIQVFLTFFIEEYQFRNTFFVVIIIF